MKRTHARRGSSSPGTGCRRPNQAPLSDTAESARWQRTDTRDDLTRRGFLATGAAVTTAATAALASPVSAERLRVGLIGVGGRGTRHLMELLGEPDVEVVAVCDIDEKALQRARSRVEEASGRPPKGFLEHRALLDVQEIDAVFSATPCDVHHRIYMDVLDSGKHLYGEKPMCLTVAEADELVRKQKEHPRLKFQVGFQRRADPRTIEGIKLTREDGVVGELVEARAAYNNSWTPRHGLGGPGSWQSRRERSGDWMLEQAVHSWDVLNWVAGSLPVRAFGLGNHEIFKQYDENRDVTDYYAAILEYPDNFVVQFSHSWISPPHPSFDGMYVRLVGMEGGVDLEAGKVIFSSRSPRPGKVREFAVERQNPTKIALRSFVDTVLKDRKPLATVHNGRDATLVGLLVRKAVHERRVVTLEEILAG